MEKSNVYFSLLKKYMHPSSACELCGKQYNLTIHHIIARTKDGCNERWNLAILCQECHNEIELLDFDTISEYRFYLRFNSKYPDIEYETIKVKRHFKKKPNRRKKIIFTQHPTSSVITPKIKAKKKPARNRRKKPTRIRRMGIFCPIKDKYNNTSCPASKRCYKKCKQYIKLMAFPSPPRDIVSLDNMTINGKTFYIYSKRMD